MPRRKVSNVQKVRAKHAAPVCQLCTTKIAARRHVFQADQRRRDARQGGKDTQRALFESLAQIGMNPSGL